MVIGEAVREGTKRLAEAGIASAGLDAEILLAYLLQKERVFLAVHRKDEIKSDVCEAYFRLIDRRRKHEPVAYITGMREFMSLSFIVRPGVLVPRPDTETLVEFAIGSLVRTSSPRILDLCTGSGAIAISLAHYLKESHVTAVDIEEICLQTARENAERLGVGTQMMFCQANALEPLAFSDSFDCVVSNPPYIETEVLQTLEQDVRDFEPVLALDGGDDGLIFYRAISKNSLSLLKSGGFLAFEVGHNQADAVAAQMQRDYENVGFKKDLAGIRRVVYGYKK